MANLVGQVVRPVVEIGALRCRSTLLLGQVAGRSALVTGGFGDSYLHRDAAIGRLRTE